MTQRTTYDFCRCSDCSDAELAASVISAKGVKAKQRLPRSHRLCQSFVSTRMTNLKALRLCCSATIETEADANELAIQIALRERLLANMQELQWALASERHASASIDQSSSNFNILSQHRN